MRHHTTPHEVVRCIVTNTNAAPKAAAKAKQKKPTAPAPWGQDELPNAPPPNSRAIRPDAFRAVCDTMVQGLGKKPRSIGADVAILENGDDHDQRVVPSRRENRVILTRGRQPHRRMAGLVSTGLCYRVDAEKAADQLEEVVIREANAPPPLPDDLVQVIDANEDVDLSDRAVICHVQQLEGNNLTVIRQADFRDLRQLRSLNLAHNDIHLLEEASFADLTRLEKLRLNNNHIRHLPAALLASLGNLQKLRLGGNRLQHLSARLLHHSPRLRVVTLEGNPLVCDCHLSWLVRLARGGLLDSGAVCHAPYQLVGRGLRSLAAEQLKCDADSRPPDSQCAPESLCPEECVCSQGSVDCRDRGLEVIPKHIPLDTIEL
ncbi:Protein slit [Amphibalanus amphitrite]|uniref:Protein slit n=1 Tax=Amphibalanus amphitrite TaxID=1232801 RepID=A0A6A4X2X1_AMPAM|nr:Protein slit [Amphibalanus amphitrite]